MGLLDMILGGGGGSSGGVSNAVIAQIAKQLGIPESLAIAAAGNLIPALTRGLQRNSAKAGGLDSLFGALQTGNHAKYLDDPQRLTQPETIDDGNKILGHILGSKDVSRNLAANAAERTGVDYETLKKMLPMLAGATMGSLSKELQEAQPAAAASRERGSAADMLSSLLGQEQSEEGTDELLDLARRYI